jgi:hypothetical protein
MKHATWCALFALAFAIPVAFAFPGACRAEQVVGIDGKCLDVPHGSTTNGTGVEIWRCGGSYPNQRWSFVGDTIVGIGGKCLDVDSGHTADGTRVQMWNCNGGPNQRWQFLNGQFIGIGHKCLDVAGANTDDGTPVLLWQCNGGPNQKWLLRPSVIIP